MLTFIVRLQHCRGVTQIHAFTGIQAHGILSRLLLHLLLNWGHSLPLFALCCINLLLQDGLNVSVRLTGLIILQWTDKAYCREHG